MRHSFYGTMIVILFFSACKESTRSIVVDDNKIINQLIHEWHKAAADANYDEYFKRMSSDAVMLLLLLLFVWLNFKTTAVLITLTLVLEIVF